MSQDYRILVFSKDRPGQLCAYLESLTYATHCPQSRICCISPSYAAYGRVRAAFPEVLWVEESGAGFLQQEARMLNKFEASVRRFLRGLADDTAVLLDVDDQVWTHSCDLERATDIVQHGKVDGFSTRLGSNLVGFTVGDEEVHDGVRSWDWTKSTGHYGYPFAVGSTMYRAGLLKQLVLLLPGMHNPNELEGWGVERIRNLPGLTYIMASSTGPASNVAQDVNRVQSVALNPTFGDEGNTAETLLRLEAEGYRVKWEHMWGKEYPDVWTRGVDWAVEKR